MNELDLIKLNIYESYNNNEISEEEKDYLLEHVDYIEEAKKNNIGNIKETLSKGIQSVGAIASKGIHNAGAKANKAIQAGGEAIGGAIKTGTEGIKTGITGQTREEREQIKQNKKNQINDIIVKGKERGKQAVDYLKNQGPKKIGKAALLGGALAATVGTGYLIANQTRASIETSVPILLEKRKDLMMKMHHCKDLKKYKLMEKKLRDIDNQIIAVKEYQKNHNKRSLKGAEIVSNGYQHTRRVPEAR